MNEKKLEKHLQICKLLHDTYAIKNRKYGDSFGISIKKYGLIAALTRLSDKWNRIETLILQNDYGTADESIKDTLLDMANYCIMTIIEMEESCVANTGLSSSSNENKES